MWVVLFQLIWATQATFDLTYSVNTILAFDPNIGRNQSQFQVQVVSFPASDTNFQDIDIQIGALHWDVEVQPPLLTNTLQLVGFVPSAGNIYGFSVSLVDSTVRFSGIQKPQNQSVFATRRLLSLESQPYSHARKLLQQSAGDFGQLATNFKKSFPVQVICCLTSIFCDDGADDATAAQIAQIQALQAWQVQATSQIGSLQTQFGNVETALGQQGHMLNIVKQQINNQQQQLGSLNNSIFALAQKQDTDNAATQAAFTQVYNNMAGAAAIVAASSDAQLKAFAAFMQTQMQGMVNATNSLRSSLLEARRQLLARSRDNTRLIRKTNQQLLELRIEKYLGRAMNAGIWQEIAQAKTDGFVPYFDPNFPGKAPIKVIPADINILSVDNQCISFVNNSGGGLMAHQICYNFLCQVNQVLDGAPLGADYEDFMEFIGPVGCSKNSSTTAAKNCKCWIQVTHKSCQPAFLEGGNTFTFTTIPPNRTNTAFTLTSSMCRTGTPQPDKWNGQTLDSLLVFNSMIGGICTANVLDDNFPSTNFVVTDPGTTSLVPSNPANPACAMQMDAIFSTPGTASPTQGNSLPFTIYTMFVVGWKSLLASNNLYESIVYGRIPNDLTCQVEHFQQLADNNTYTKHTCEFVAVAPTTLPVFEVVNTAIVDNVLATAYDRSPVCTFSGCVFGNVVQQTFTQTASYTIPKLPEAPQVGDIIIGILAATGTTSYIDNPRPQNILIPVPAARAGAITYLLQSVPANYNLTTAAGFPATALLDKWKLNNPFGYSALDAALFANMMENDLVSGRPVLSPGQPPQWMTAQLKDFTIHPLTDMKHHLQYIIYPNQFGAQVSLEVNLGPIAQIVYEGCADISITYYTDGTADYSLNDPWPFPIQGILRVRQVDRTVCADVGDKDFSLIPKQQVIQTVTPCGNQSFQVFQKIPGQPLVPCGKPLYVNSAVPLVNQVNRAVFGGFNSTTLVDQIQVNTIDTGTQAAQLLEILLPFYVPAILGPVAIFKPNRTISQAIADYNKGLIAIGQKPVFSNKTAVQIITPYIVIFNNLTKQNQDLARQFDQVQGNNTETLRQIHLLNVNISLGQQKLNNLSAALTLANANLIAALERQKAASISSCPSCPNIIIIHDICCELQNIGIWIAYIIMAVIIAGIVFGVYYLVKWALAIDKSRQVSQQIREMKDTTKLMSAQQQTAAERSQITVNVQPTAPSATATPAAAAASMPHIEAPPPVVSGRAQMYAIHRNSNGDDESSDSE